MARGRFQGEPGTHDPALSFVCIGKSRAGPPSKPGSRDECPENARARGARSVWFGGEYRRHGATATRNRGRSLRVRTNLVRAVPVLARTPQPRACEGLSPGQRHHGDHRPNGYVCPNTSVLRVRRTTSRPPGDAPHGSCPARPHLRRRCPDRPGRGGGRSRAPRARDRSDRGRRTGDHRPCRVGCARTGRGRGLRRAGRGRRFRDPVSVEPVVEVSVEPVAAEPVAVRGCRRARCGRGLRRTCCRGGLCRAGCGRGLERTDRR